jgi:hypothetical protein
MPSAGANDDADRIYCRRARRRFHRRGGLLRLGVEGDAMTLMFLGIVMIAGGCLVLLLGSVIWVAMVMGDGDE